MKGKRLFDAMQDIDDRFVTDAAPGAPVRRTKDRLLRWGALAASLLLVVTVALVLFLPYDTSPPDISDYQVSEYYPIIQKLNLVTYRPPRYKNNFELLLDHVEDLFLAKAESEAPTTEMIGESGGGYVETTDNQVGGVIEGDLIKRSESHIYYLSPEGVLSVYSIAGEASELVGYYRIPDAPGAYRQNGYAEMYLSEDCRTVTVLSPYLVKRSHQNQADSRSYVEVISLDVSDPGNIQKKGSVAVSGSYTTSRMVEGKLLLISGFYVGNDPDFSREESFLPQINTGEGFSSIPLSGILSPETLSSSRYTVVCKLNEADLALEGCAAFLSYSQEVYVSTDSIWATRSYTEVYGGEEESVRVTLSEISRLSYAGDQLCFAGSVTVKGYVKDQYSLDQTEEFLRVVTTTQEEFTYENATPNEWGIVNSFSRKTNASLYCVDLDSMQILSSVEKFAPDGETVRSVRFDGDSAYVCTAVQMTDPVFFFDLSDPERITYTDTGTISGFSTSLIQLGDGYLLGIGQGADWSSVKLEVYEERDGRVVSVAVREFSGAYYSTVYKSYLVDREHWLVGLGINFGSYASAYAETERYLLLAFDGSELSVLLNTALRGENESKRAVIIDEYLYLFSENDFKVVPMP